MKDILAWVTQFNFSSRLNNLQGKLRGSETDAMFKDKYIKYETVFFKHNVNSQMQVYSEKLTGSNEGYTLQVKKQIYEMVTCNNGKTSSEKNDVMPRAGIEPTSLGFMSECDTTTLSRQPCWQQSPLNDM